VGNQRFADRLLATFARLPQVHSADRRAPHQYWARAGRERCGSVSYVLEDRWNTMDHPFRQGYAFGVADAVETVSGWYVFDRKYFDASLRAAFACVQSRHAKRRGRHQVPEVFRYRDIGRAELVPS